ncbi:leucine-rich repeat (LRR) protein [Rivularia sp. PCC 7116]|uniref:leucine-rich repeat domain-containing protein n=1 Tax=Rivularia sp. PCC 7116 TaxID=373994 RepID=UPI00029F397C|nr:COR domain-containing protein [Rivularia sp. PCC 7116]AFY54454.1 leucine-rich repeat (LRR) protein [Rivularia sp. PCC 7116]
MTEEELLLIIERAATQGCAGLDLSGNELTVLPPEIGKLTQLKRLILGKYRYDDKGRIVGTIGNKLSKLPREIGLLAQLEEFHIVRNKLSSLPAEIGQLAKLQSLNLSHNRLSSLPAEIGQLTKLQSLDLSFNQLSSLPAEIGQLAKLQSLNLSHNRLSSLPAEIGQLTKLQTLDLYNNQLSSLPAEIGQLTKLQTLDLYNNQLSSLPAEIGQLTKLQTLDLYNNQLSSLPAEIGQLTNLQFLHLSHNKLSSLPAEIVQLTNLQFLHLSHNKLSSLPAEIVQLTNLQSLDLSHNKLSSLPAEIGQLTKLQFLNLKGNQLNSLPTEIGHLYSCLRELKLDSNLLESPPPEILSKGTKAILNFYKQQLEQTIDRLYEAKFLIIGEGGAGKTSLAKKIEDENYKLKPDEESTEGIDVIQWKFPLDNGKEFRVNIWDFGGQEIYHQTHQFFLTERSLYALVADSRRENTDFYWWLKVAELLSDQSPILIVQNEKQDRQCEVNERQLRGEFTNLEKVLVTNLATNRGLEEIKKNIKLYISNLPHVGTELPKTWVEIRSSIEEDSRNYISKEEYYKLCETNHLTDRKDMLFLSRFLHDLGVCLHFQDDSTLKHYVILKPEWATNAVYKVLDNQAVRNNLGRFNQKELANIWKDRKYAQMQDELLQLMMRFKLCYEIPNCPGNYIAPQLLEIDQPEYTWDKSNNLILSYKYEFMPKGIITRFIVETHDLIEQQQLVWRSGVVLNKDETRAEVIENYYQREIKVRVSGSRKKELLVVVNRELEKIHRSFERLEYQTLVPCNCEKCAGSKNPNTYPLEILYKRLNAGVYDIQCEQNNFVQVDVRRLIEDVNLFSQREDRKFNTQNVLLEKQLPKRRGQILKELTNAIIDAYPNKTDLEMMVYFQLNENLNSITGGENTKQIVFELIKWAESTDKLEKLVHSACESNPGNQKLQRISKELLSNLRE